jgi:hypothetical protein
MSYITLAEMGSSGGLCSQLQIYSGLMAVAKANNKTVVFAKEMLSHGVGIRVFDLLDLPYELKPLEFFNDFQIKYINFHTTRYDETLFSLDNDVNYNLAGRFDLYTYWYDAIGNEIAQWKYQPSLQSQAESRMSKIKEHFGNDNPIVSIHIRRGDYLLPHHSFCELDADYYTQAIVDHFLPVEDYNFLVFSNDISYAKELFEGDNIHFIDPIGGEKICSDSEKEDLALMSLCDHHITANSSYSWWGAYLCKNPNKKIICPTNWLKSNHQSSWINGNYYPPTWININNEC